MESKEESCFAPHNICKLYITYIEEAYNNWISCDEEKEEERKTTDEAFSNLQVNVKEFLTWLKTFILFVTGKDRKKLHKQFLTLLLVVETFLSKQIYRGTKKYGGTAISWIAYLKLLVVPKTNLFDAFQKDHTYIYENENLSDMDCE